MRINSFMLRKMEEFLKKLSVLLHVNRKGYVSSEAIPTDCIMVCIINVINV